MSVMKIGVLADTHFSDLATGLAFLDALCRGPFADVERILHAGDVVHPDLLYCFDAKPVVGVRGNCDDASSALPDRQLLRFGKFRIGLMHGWGGRDGIIGNVTGAFDDADIDALVFGHSHTPCCRRAGSLLLFNPGSPTDRRDAACHSVGILTLDTAIRGEIVNIDPWLEAGSIDEGVLS